MDDPEDSKPEDWDQPEHVADPDATKPEDWDDEMDGEWEPPMIDNPEYKGEWKPRQIDNPDSWTLISELHSETDVKYWSFSVTILPPFYCYFSLKCILKKNNNKKKKS